MFYFVLDTCQVRRSLADALSAESLECLGCDSFSEGVDAAALDEARQALLARTTSQLVTQLVAAVPELAQGAIAKAHAEWKALREAERRDDQENASQALRKAVELAQEDMRRAHSAAVDSAIADVRAARAHETQGAVDVAVRTAVSQTRDALHAEAQRELSRAAREGFERGKAAMTRSAEQAVLASVREASLAQARRELTAQIEKARAETAEARKQARRQALLIEYTKGYGYEVARRGRRMDAAEWTAQTLWAGK